MSLDLTTIRRVARLARIGVNEHELAGFQKDLNGILAWIDQLEEVDTDHVAVALAGEEVSSTLCMREDAVTDGNCPDAILSNAPDRWNNFFSVPRMVE